MTDPTPHPPCAQLQRASRLLDTAATLAAEACDASLPLSRALITAIGILATTSQALVDGAIHQLKPPAQ
ncbi:hypothetical protein [Pseudomonas sp. KNUC1026]|uniref:hypothetical protein n=1 Tax=Pseudomonas sp. KNUC1026 TaxID=2893890 RepID=UPI001F1C2B5F|nr:hypothetical protein [Pseudomonas sp. KNUC1026]UFH49913.1 hypothetical protein LN139_00510 [Pseudomonas sp. KNUC1026]